MRELHGVVYGARSMPPAEFKRQTMLFDRFHLIDRFEAREDEWDWLKEMDVLRDVPGYVAVQADVTQLDIQPRTTRKQSRDGIVRYAASTISKNADFDVACICELPLPNDLLDGPPHLAKQSSMETILAIALEAFPVPDETCAWDDIINFKAEMANKRWAFRRFLTTFASKQQTEAEVRDDIEWSLNEYTKEMDRFKLKRTVSFMETYVIPTVEALEGLRPSAFLKGFVAIRKRKIELLEGEAKAAGRECAYVFDARKRFGPR